MSSFNVRPDKLQICAESINNSFQVLRRAGSDVLSVSNNLPFNYKGHERLSAQIKSQNEALLRSEKTIAEMGKNLSEIASLYRKTDSYNANQAGAVSKAIAEAAIAAGIAAGTITTAADGVATFFRNLVIAIHEALDPEMAEKVNNFLNSGRNNKLTDEEKLQIKEKIYTAKEPYKTIYLKYLERYSIGDADVEGGKVCYKPGEKTVNYNYSDDRKDSYNDDPRGPYTAFFHESGHAIDDLANLTNEAGYDTTNFTCHSDAMGRDVTLSDAIKYDVYYNTNNPHSVTSMANDIMSYNKSCQGADVNAVIKAMQTGDTSSLSSASTNLYNSVRDEFRAGLSNGYEKFESVSDVYGGASNNTLQYGYGHDNSYWKNMGSKGPALELWAEYFSYNMSGNTENLAHMREYFPEAAKVCDAYANSLAA